MRIVVVTGAGSGVGLATVKALRNEGKTVVGIDLQDRPAEVRGDDQVDWVRGDVAVLETWRETVEAVSQRDQAGADALITCAGNIVVGPILETSIEDWRRIFDINFFGVLNGIRALLPPMLARGRGAVAVVCSVNSLYAEDQLSAYSVSKAALLHLVRSAALEHASRGIRINAVLPGFIDTPLLKRALDQVADPAGARRVAERRIPTGKILDPEEVASVLCFLISEAASGMSGSAVVVDGGLTTAYDFQVTP